MHPLPARPTPVRPTRPRKPPVRPGKKNKDKNKKWGMSEVNFVIGLSTLKHFRLKVITEEYGTSFNWVELQRKRSI